MLNPVVLQRSSLCPEQPFFHVVLNGCWLILVLAVPLRILSDKERSFIIANPSRRYQKGCIWIAIGE